PGPADPPNNGPAPSSTAEGSWGTYPNPTGQSCGNGSATSSTPTTATSGRSVARSTLSDCGPSATRRDGVPQVTRSPGELSEEEREQLLGIAIEALAAEPRGDVRDV